MSSVRNMKSILKFVAIYVLFSAVLGGLALLQLFPIRPRSWDAWLLFFTLIVPFTIIFEFVGELLCRNTICQAVEYRTSNKRFSWLRIFTWLVFFINSLFPQI